MITRFMVCILIILVGFTACKKKSNTSPSTSPATPQYIALDTLSVSGQLIKLKWSGLQGDSQTMYLVYQYSDTTTAPDAVFQVDKYTTHFTVSMELAPYITYKVAALFASGSKVISNSRSFARTDINFLPFMPVNVLFDRSAHQLFLFGQTIVVYDIPSAKIIKQIVAPNLSGSCDLATHNGVKELYTPQSNGQLVVYNIATMTKTDSINVGGWLNGVVYNNGLLFITADGSDSGIKVYNRTTKQKIAETPSGSPQYIQLIPGTTFDFVAAGAPYSAYHFRFNSSGSYISQQYSIDSLHYCLPTAIFPDGSKMLSTAWGNGDVFDTNLHYLASLPKLYEHFTSFDFDVPHQLIYAGMLETQIEIFSMSDYHLVNTIKSQGHPRYVFYDNGSVIAVSITQYNNTGPGPSFPFIEQF